MKAWTHVFIISVLASIVAVGREPPLLLRDPAGQFCKSISPGDGTGVLLGQVSSRDGKGLGRAIVSSIGVRREPDGGTRANDTTDSTTADDRGFFFLSLSGGPLCAISMRAPGYSPMELVVECSARTCIQVALERLPASRAD
jgi:hypothetical protein